jgi:hypothetical protein
MIGFFFILFSFVVSGAFSETSIPPVVPIAILLLISFYVIILLKHGMGMSGNKAQKVFFACGILFLFVPLGIVNELNGLRGMSVVGVLLGLFIVDFMRWSEGTRVRVFKVGRILYGT